jgi:isopenicillin-N epimerase
MEARVRQLTGHLMKALAEDGKLSLRTNANAELHCGVVKVDLPGVKDLASLDAKLYAEQGMAFSVTGIGPMRGIRVSPHVYNTKAQMERIAEALRKAA